MFCCLIGVNPLIDCSPLDALALVRGLGSKLGLALALPEDRFAFLLRCAGSGLGLLESPLTVDISEISLLSVRAMTSGHRAVWAMLNEPSHLLPCWAILFFQLAFFHSRL